MPCGIGQTIILTDHTVDTYNHKQANSHQWSSNFLKFNFAPMATSKGLAQQMREWNQEYHDVPNHVFVAASHFNRLIILLLDIMPQHSPTLEEQEMGLRHEINFNQNIGSDLKQIC